MALELSQGCVLDARYKLTPTQFSKVYGYNSTTGFQRAGGGPQASLGSLIAAVFQKTTGFSRLGALQAVTYTVKVVVSEKWREIRYDTIRYDTRCCFNVRSKVDMSRLNLPHGNDN